MAWRLRINKPLVAAIAVLRATTSGIAKPSACGQAMMKTVTIRSNAVFKSAKKNQLIKAIIPATNAA